MTVRCMVIPKGSAIKERRAALDMSQAQLAELMHTTQPQIAAFESGKGTRPITLQAMAYNLGEPDWTALAEAA